MTNNSLCTGSTFGKPRLAEIRNASLTRKKKVNSSAYFICFDACGKVVISIMDNEHDDHHHYPIDEGSFSSEPTPVPKESPPPPTYQRVMTNSDRQQQQQLREGGGRGRPLDNFLVDCASLSLSVDDVATLPSAALEPPSPLSRQYEYPPSPINAKMGTTPAATLSLARSRRKQQLQKNYAYTETNNPAAATATVTAANNTKNNNNYYSSVPPPIHEVIMDDNEDHETNQDNTSTVGGESDTSFECIEDRSLANRARRSLRSDGPSSHRSLLSSPDGQPDIPKQQEAVQDHRSNVSDGHYYSDGMIGSDDVVRVHESALHALQKLKEELVKSNQRSEGLSREKESWQREQQHLRQKLTLLQNVDQQRESELHQLQHDHKVLQQDQERVKRERDLVVEEKQNLEIQSRETARITKELRHRTLAADNRHKELKGQLDIINDELETALAAKGEIGAELARTKTEQIETEKKLTEVQNTLSDVTSEKESALQNDQEHAKQLLFERNKYQELRKSSEVEISRLNSSLRKADESLHRLRAELTPKVLSAVRKAATPSHTSGRLDAPLVPPTLDSAIADRLAGLRDSTERAHLIRVHKRELTRLKADRDHTIGKLENEHALALKKVTKQFDAKRVSDIENVTHKLKQEHELRIEEFEEEHRKRISQLQKEVGRSQEDSNESLEEALSRIAQLTHDHDGETTRRQALERTVDDLRRQMRSQQKDDKIQHVGELDKHRREWESEKEMLLGSLQRDCNDAFDNTRRDWTASTKIIRDTMIHTNDCNNTGIGNDDNRKFQLATTSPRYLNQQQQQQQSTRTSPLSMNSVTMFFPENKSPVDTIPDGKGVFIAASPRLNSSPAGSPSVISKSYSDIDSVLRQTEELVQSIL